MVLIREQNNPDPWFIFKITNLYKFSSVVERSSVIASYSRQDIVVISPLNLQKSRSISPNIIPCSKIKANLRFLFYKHLFSAYTYVKVIAEKVIPHENYKVEPSGVPRNDICLIKVPSLRESSPPDCIGKCSKHFHPFAPDEQLADNNSTFFFPEKN